MNKQDIFNARSHDDCSFGSKIDPQIPTSQSPAQAFRLYNHHATCDVATINLNWYYSSITGGFNLYLAYYKGIKSGYYLSRCLDRISC
jgi:hypothetical protein